MRDPVGSQCEEAAPRRQWPQANLLTNAGGHTEAVLLFPSNHPKRIADHVKSTARMLHFTNDHFIPAAWQ